MNNVINTSLICIYLIFSMVNVSCQKEEEGAPTEQKRIEKVEIDMGKVENEALGIANSWLELVDAGEYSESWDEAAKLFKGVILY